jgi:hypothetical protein
MENKDKATQDMTTALAELSDELEEDAQGYTPQMVVIKIAHDTSLFAIPSLKPVKRIVGVILASKRVRVFFPKFGVEAAEKQVAEVTNNRPICASNDYENGIMADVDWASITDQKHPAIIIKGEVAKGGLSCRTCPYNVWGSVGMLGKEGKGKACSDIRRLLLWKEGIKISQLLQVPTTSIRAWDNYCSSLDAAGLKHNAMITEIGLEARSNGGRNWSVLNFSAGDEITNPMAKELLAIVPTPDGPKELHRYLRDVFHGREIDPDDDAETTTSEAAGDGL